MADFSSLGGGDTVSPPNTVAPIAAGAYPAGTPVYLNGSGQVAPAEANAIGTAGAIGVLRYASQEGSPAEVQWGGSLTLEDSQWASVVAGAPSGGLTPGAPYFVSPSTAGLLTVTSPTVEGEYIVVVGYAESANSLFIQPGAPQLHP